MKLEVPLLLGLLMNYIGRNINTLKRLLIL